MKYIFKLVLGLILGFCLTATALAQNQDIQEYLQGYEKAQAVGETDLAAKYAWELVRMDFSGTPFLPLEARNIKTELTEAMADSGLLKESVTVLGDLIGEDKRQWLAEDDRVLKSDIRAGQAERLLMQASLYEQLGANKRALKPYQDAHVILTDRSNFSKETQVVGTSALFPRDPVVASIRTAINTVTSKYPNAYRGLGDANMSSTTSNIVALLTESAEQNRRESNANAIIENLYLIKFYTEFQCGRSSLACPTWDDSAARPSLEAVKTELATYWMELAIPKQPLGDRICAVTGDPENSATIQQNERLAQALADSWAQSGDQQTAAVQDRDALAEAHALLGGRDQTDPLYACLRKLQARVNEAAGKLQIEFIVSLPAMSHTGTNQDDRNFETLTVFYGTNRALDNARKPDKTFGRKSGELSYGWIDMTVPKDRALGEVPRPGILSFTGARDGVHIVLSRVDRTEDVSVFSQKFSESIETSTRPRKEAFVYIHGHGNSFADSARRAAQLAIDLDIREGASFFSWPVGSVVRYGYSEDRVKETVAPLKSFLTTIATESGADKIHIIAHSMGNRILLKALQEMNDPNLTASNPLFDQIIWASPDVAAVDFARDIKGVAEKANSLTLYASRHDRALKLSSFLHKKLRAGQAPPLEDVTNVSDVITTIDTSSVALRSKDFIAHADYAGGAITDLRSIVWLSLSPDSRKCTILKTATAPYWEAGSPSDCPEVEYGLALTEVRLNGLLGARRSVQSKIQAFRTASDFANAQTWEVVARILEAPNFVWQ